MQFTFWEPITDVCAGPDETGVEIDIRNQLCLGAEYLVAADLSFAGHHCFLSSPRTAFDLAIETQGRLLRIQVKSTVGVRRESKGDNKIRRGYIFDGGSRSAHRSGLNSYIGEAEIFAFVALDIRRVMYARVGATPNRLIIKPEAFSEDACSLSLKVALSGDTQ